MAGKFAHSSDSTNTLYFFVYRISDSFIYDAGDTAFEAIGVWDDARAGECDIAMTGVGDVHFGTFPVVVAGVYFVQIRIQAGASPDVNDEPDGQGIAYWDGTNFINTTTLDTSINDDIIGENGDTLQTLSDQLDSGSARQSTVLNVYPRKK